MADVLTREQRSFNMSRIRSSGNKTTEGALAAAFRAAGIKGWRRHASLPGKPDFVFRRERVAVFVHGCFWHGCARCYRKPKSNKSYWSAKVARNRRRDQVVRRLLRLMGWNVVTVWEHEMSVRDSRGRVTIKVEHALRDVRSLRPVSLDSAVPARARMPARHPSRYAEAPSMP
jgi:DNA mismatch endonuclease (patch repair protein)